MISHNPSPFCASNSFGNITRLQVKGILTENKMDPGQFILWYCEEDKSHKVTCVTKSRLKVVHIPVSSPKYIHQIAKASGINESKLKQLDPVAYHLPKILRQNKKTHDTKFLLDPEVLEKVLKTAAKFVESSAGVFIDKVKVPELNDRKIVVVFEKKLRVYELLEGEDNKLGEGGFSKTFQVRNLRSGKMCARKIFKTEKYSEEDSPQLEHQILNRIHANGIVPGIQKPFQVSVKISISPEIEDFSSIGPLYEGNLRDFATELTPQNIKLFIKEILTVFKGLKYCHKIGITNNDIKRTNIFYKSKENGFEFFLADFGGGYDFKNLLEDIRNIRTVQYVYNKENKLVRHHIKYKNEDALFEISKKKDVFALGIVGYKVLMGSHPLPEKDEKGFIASTNKYNGEPLQNALVNKYQVPPKIAKKIDRMMSYMLKCDWKVRADMKDAARMLKKCIKAWNAFDANKKEKN